MSEKWLPIPGWEGLYDVSSEGQVRRCARAVPFKDGRVRSYSMEVLGGWKHNGYPMVMLQDKPTERKRRVFVHRLVCEAFIGPAPSPLHEVAHEDGNPANSRLGNLRWATHIENEGDKLKHGTRALGERNANAKLTPQDVRKIRQSSAPLAILAEQFGVSKPQVCLIRNRKSWRHELEPA